MSGSAGNLQQVDHPEFQPRSFIDQGGMGSILEVTETRTGRPVALKVMHPETMRSEEAVDRFYLEARVLARLEHPNIVPLHVLKTDKEGRPFYTMKKITGQTLQAILSGLRKGDPETIAAFPLRRLVRVFNRVCDALAFAHANGVVHRDLKPANIMVGEFGEVLVMDWGLAKELGEPETQRPAEMSDQEVSSRQDGLEAGSMTISAGPGALTREGAVMGTPQYMSPEQARGLVAQIDQRSDVFALGGLLYAILTLHPPFYGETIREILVKVCRGEFEDPELFTDPDETRRRFSSTRSDFTLAHCPGGRAPSGLVAVAVKAMSVAPAGRYQTVGNLQLDIEAWLDGRTTSVEEPSLWRAVFQGVRRHRVLFAALLLVMGLAVAFTVKVRRDRAQAEAALRELRGTLPMFEREARALTSGRKFAEALAYYDQCLALSPGRGEYLAAKGNLYQAMLDFPASIEAYEAALQQNDALPHVAENIALSRRLTEVSGNQIARMNALGNLRRAMESQRRVAEADAIRAAMGDVAEDVSAETEKWREQMLKAGAKKHVASRLRRDGSRLTLDLGGLAIASLDFLKDVPVNVLDISETRVKSLAALRSLPLERLDISGTPVTSLSDLANRRLRELRAARTAIADLSPLKGMPLQLLDVAGTQVSDLSSLHGRPLVEVDLRDCKGINDVSPVISSRLKRLNLGGVGGVNLGLLTGLKLEELDLRACRVNEVSFVAGMPLQRLVLDENPVSDLRPLAGLKLRALSVASSGIATLDSLAGMRLKELTISGTRVTDLGPMAKMPLEEFEARACPVTDVTPLRGLPLKRIDLTGCANLRDVTALGDCLELEYAALPTPRVGRLNLGPLRSLPHLRNITVRFDRHGYQWKQVPPADSPEGLWAFYDAKWAPAFKER